MNANNSSLGPPPLATPITANSQDETGVPFQSRGLPSGNLAIAWGAWFNFIYQRILGSPLTVNSLQANLATLAASLGQKDTGLLVNVTDYAHVLQWTGSAWQRGPGDNEHSDTFHEFGAVPTDTGWHACDGLTVNFLKYDGTLGSRILPNTNATAAFAKGGPAYSQTLHAPTVPTISGATDSATIAITGNTAVDTGAGETISYTAGAVVVTVAQHTHVHGAGGLANTHTHPLSAANAPIALPADPVEWFAVIRMYRQ